MIKLTSITGDYREPSWINPEHIIMMSRDTEYSRTWIRLIDIEKGVAFVETPDEIATLIHAWHWRCRCEP